MDYGRPVEFGVFITPDATRPEHQLELAALADEVAFDLVGVQDHPYQRRFASEVVPAVREAVAKAR